MSSRPTLRSIGPAVLLGLLGFVFTVEWRVQSRAADELDGRRAQLAAVVDARQRRASDLEARLAELREEFTRLGASSTQPVLRRLRGDVERLAALSGARVLAGPGVVVELADADDGDEGDSDDGRIQDVDIQSVVNALWLAGAEGIAVNGQRLVATSAIRNAGGAVLVNYRVLVSPYRITAVGQAGAMRSAFLASEIARRFRAWTQIYGLGFTIASEGTVRLPAFSGSIRFRHARPIEKA